MKLSTIRNMDDLIFLIEKIGFLPFFANEIRGFSIEECCDPKIWFSNEDGPWEWKGPIIRTRKFVYGKFFEKKAGFISLERFPHFANYRRDGYDFDARTDEGLVNFKDIAVYNAVADRGTLLSKQVKHICNYRKGGNVGFETVITRLQMQTYITVGDFEYETDKNGAPYGWGIARYTTPEFLFGRELIASEYRTKPEVSKQILIDHLCSALDVKAEAVEKLIK